MIDVKALLLKAFVYAAILGVFATPILLWVHPPWLAFTASGVLLFFALICFVISPSGTGHVLDSIASYLILSVLILIVAFSVGSMLRRHLNPPVAPKGIPSER
ncbi:MAG TPA: hypothetical protein PK280_14650 [Planctomycetota bacterium]|nr:hypothetical protein [Planctomycetota bacterium]